MRCSCCHTTNLLILFL
ncbi:hypothetical protein [uncultured Lactobacillus sp.]